MIVPVQRKLRQRRSCCSWERICSARLRLGFGCGRLIADDDDDDRNETSSFVVLNRGGGYCVGWATDKGWPAVCAVGQRRCVDNCAWNDWSDVSQLFYSAGCRRRRCRRRHWNSCVCFARLSACGWWRRQWVRSEPAARLVRAPESEKQLGLQDFKVSGVPNNLVAICNFVQCLSNCMRELHVWVHGSATVGHL